MFCHRSTLDQEKRRVSYETSGPYIQLRKQLKQLGALDIHEAKNEAICVDLSAVAGCSDEFSGL
jgi:hypothetical protein